MKFPSKEKIKEVLKELDSVEGTLGLPENPTELQNFRHSLQQGFVRYKREQNLSVEGFSGILGISNDEAYKILHHRLDGFSTDLLLKLYLEIYPNMKLKIE